MGSYDSLSLAGLDSPMVLQLDRPSSHLSSLTNASCCTSFSPRTPPKLKAAIINVNDSPSFKSTASHPSFELLPPVPNVSSFQLSFICNVKTPPPSPRPAPKLLPPEPLQHQYSVNSSRQAVEDHHQSGHRTIMNNPYTPWPNSIRPLIISPATSSNVTVSPVSQYSRPYSRSGARAPEPSDSDTSLSGVGCGISGFTKWRKMKRNVRVFSRKLHTFGAILRKRNVTRTSISSAHFRPSSVISIAFTISSRSSSCRSAISLSRDSLASWIDERNRASIEYASSLSPGHESMEIEEYERRGSWLMERGCDDWGCKMHGDEDAKNFQVEHGKYYDVALAAGQEALSRRRRRVTSTDSV